jgi:hypothetical protein
MEDLAAPPATLTAHDGAPREGAYAGAIPATSLAGARIPFLGPLAGVEGARRLFRGLRRKSWRFAGVFRDDLVVVAAIADVGYLGVAMVYVAEGSQVLERTWKAPGALGMRVGPADGTSVALAPSRLISLGTTRAGGLHVAIDVPGLRADLDVSGDATPLTVVSDVGRGAGLHGVTVKSAGMRTRGSVVVEGRSYTLDDARACLDWTEAYFPRRTTWFWATGAGMSIDGTVVGFNLAKGVHDDRRGRFSENALWLDGKPSALPPMRFEPGTGKKHWTVRSDDGAVDLVFEPVGERGEDVHLLVVSSKYRQPFGTFTGRLRDVRGREVRIEGLPGVAEEHDARW